MTEQEHYARRTALRRDLDAAAAILAGLVHGWSRHRGPHEPCPFAAPLDAVREAARWQRSTCGGLCPVGQRFATAAERRRYGATHVLYQDATGSDAAIVPLRRGDDGD